MLVRTNLAVLRPSRYCVSRTATPPGLGAPPHLPVHSDFWSVVCHSQAGRGPNQKPKPAAATAKQGAKPAVQAKPAKPAVQAKPAGDSKKSLFLIVGLGNPGNVYERTRHNVGFMVVDELARLEGIDCRRLEKGAVVGKGEICGQQVLLVKPQTFMNNSGECVSSLAKFYKVPLSDILVISDDLEQPTAGVKLQAKGGHGGHNGLRSIMERMGNSQDFPRIKIGIGRPAGQLPVAAYVIQDFGKKEAEVIAVAIRETVDIIRNVLAVGCEAALASK